MKVCISLFLICIIAARIEMNLEIKQLAYIERFFMPQLINKLMSKVS